MLDSSEVPGQARIEAIRHMSSDAFASKYSAETLPPAHFADKVGYFITNEYDYPESLKDIKARGGIHLAIMGGVDPVLGQIAVANPDLTVMMDINPFSLGITTKGRIDLLAESQDSTEYWTKVGNFFIDVVRKIEPKRWDFPTPEDSKDGGWSSTDYFPKVKKALAEGKIKWAAGDITKDGIELALKLARETGIPVRLIYVSNIFDYSGCNKGEFAKRLVAGIEEGIIDYQAQVIDTASKDGIKSRVFNIDEYIQAATSQ